MAEPSTAAVRCPLCGEKFDPGAAGGWCTNGDCGEWQYDGGAVPDPIESVQPEAAPSEEAAAVIDDAGPDLDFPRASQQSTDGGGTDPTNEEAVEADPPAEVPAGGTASGPESEAEPDGGASESESRDDAEPAPDEGAAESTDSTAAESAKNPDGLDTCPTCEAAVEPSDSFCSNCGTDLSAAAREPTLTACPNCGADIDETARFCPDCGEHLDPHRESAVQQADRIVLQARGQTVTVSDGDTVGREFRRILTETGGEVEDAVKIHREHVRILREEGRFYLVDLGENPTVVNDERLRKGHRRPIESGDTITLSDVLTVTVEDG